MLSLVNTITNNAFNGLRMNTNFDMIHDAENIVTA